MLYAERGYAAICRNMNDNDSDNFINEHNKRETWNYYCASLVLVIFYPGYIIVRMNDAQSNGQCQFIRLVSMSDDHKTRNGFRAFDELALVLFASAIAYIGYTVL